MEMVPYNVEEIEKERARPGAIYALLDKFLSSDHQCVKVTGWHNAKAEYCRNVFDSVIKRRRLFGVKVVVRKNEVFLVKKDY